MANEPGDPSAGEEAGARLVLGLVVAVCALGSGLLTLLLLATTAGLAR